MKEVHASKTNTRKVRELFQYVVAYMISAVKTSLFDARGHLGLL